MNRRQFVESLIGVTVAVKAFATSTLGTIRGSSDIPFSVAGQRAAAALASKHDWIVIAHTGRNSNGNVYTLDNLTDMHGGIVGKHVYSENGVNGLESLRGLVGESRREKDSLAVKVYWFSGRPKGLFYLTPTGFAEGHNFTFDAGIGVKSDVTFTRYRLDHLALSTSSSFAGATQFEL